MFDFFVCALPFNETVCPNLLDSSVLISCFITVLSHFVLLKIMDKISVQTNEHFHKSFKRQVQIYNAWVDERVED